MQYLNKIIEVGLLSMTIIISSGLGIIILHGLMKIIPWEKEDDEDEKY